MMSRIVRGGEETRPQKLPEDFSRRLLVDVLPGAYYLFCLLQAPSPHESDTER